YHPHADETVQMAMGMHGFIVVHPRDANQYRVDRDFVFLINAYDIDPGSATPKVNTMTDFSLWTFNSRAFPGIDSLVVRKGDRVPTMIGVEQQDIMKKITKLVPDYMVMGDKGMADMGAMEMPLPANTLPMMTGRGPYGPLEMGGMFTVVKVREGLARNDYK